MIQIRNELERIVASKAFSRSERLREFLRFIVEQTVYEPGGILKEYSIATAVYGRPPSFDPRSDPIVRVEARRLRKKLAEYYRGEGSDASLEIRLPSGTYVPVISGRARATPRPGFKEDGVPHRIAVEPFVAVSDTGAGTDEFSRGLTEELLHSLSFDQVGIMALDTAAGPDPPWSQRAWERPHVDAVLHGAIRRRGAELRVSVRLTRTADRAVIWSEIYARTAGDLEAQRDIARGIARAVKDKCCGGEPAQEQDCQPLPPARARAHPSAPDREPPRDTTDLPAESANPDPDSAKRHLAFAEACMLAALFGDCPGTAVLPKIRDAATAALRICPDLAEARSAAALAAALGDFDFAGAERECRRSLVRDPQSPRPSSWYRICCLLLERRFAEAFLQSRLAYPELLGTLRQRAQPFEVNTAARGGSDVPQEFFLEHWLMGMGYEEYEMFEAAAASYRKADSLSSGTACKASLGRVYALMGRRADAVRVLNELSASSSGYVSPFDVASICGGLGDAESAMNALLRAYEECCPWLISLSCDHRFRSLRGEPRFGELLRRLSGADAAHQ